MSHTESEFLRLLGEEVRAGGLGKLGYKHRKGMLDVASLLRLGEDAVEFLASSFSPGGLDRSRWSSRAIGGMLRRKSVSRLVEWGYGEGLCDNGRMCQSEFEAWIAELMRDESADWSQRKWAGEMWAKLRGQEKSSGVSSGGAAIQIVIANPYGGGEVRSRVSGGCASQPVVEAVS